MPDNRENNLEIELKLRFDPPEIKDKISNDALLTDLLLPGTRHSKYLENIYYDTETCALKRAGLAYRIRRQDQELVATIKADGEAAGGLHRRAEWSVVVKNQAPDISPFFDTLVGQRLQNAIQEEPLQELFKTCFWRESMDLKLDGEGRVEIAIDHGEIRAGKGAAPIQEVELELKEGHVAKLLQLAALLAGKYPLLPEMQSKYYRGLKLAGLDRAEDKEVLEKPTLSLTETAGGAFSRVLAYCVQQVFAEQENCLREAADHAAIASLGSAVRRLYAVVIFSKELLPQKEYHKISSALESVAEMIKAALENDKIILRETIASGKFMSALLNCWACALEIPANKTKTAALTLEEYRKRYPY